MSYFARAIPFFFLLIAVELVISLWRRRTVYGFSDSVNNLSCGILQELVGVFFKAAMGAAYVLTYERLAPWHLPATWWSWAIALIGVDFFYYWFHRASHRVAFFWAFHVVHHQSEEYNLTVALRQSALGGFFNWIFYLPLALAGIAPEMFVGAYAANLLYQFWIHTRLIGSLGPVEAVLNTPSHHRVHHGRNAKYIDRNYAGALIVWDRWFGTFQREEEEPVYGIVKPLRSWNPLWANIHVWVELWRNACTASQWTDRIRCFFRPPGWQPAMGNGPLPAVEPDLGTPKYVGNAAGRAAWYIGVQFVLALAVTAFFFFRADLLDTASRMVLAGFIILSLVAFGAALDGRGWSRGVEAARLLYVALALLWYLSGTAIPAH